MNEIDRHVGKRLRRERIALSRSLSEQAELIGVDAGALELFEIGIVRLGAADLFKCCSTLGLKPSDLFDDLMKTFPPSQDRPADYRDA